MGLPAAGRLHPNNIFNRRKQLFEVGVQTFGGVANKFLSRRLNAPKVEANKG
jgi:hypothetical protein